jgi:hypothetical protein
MFFNVGPTKGADCWGFLSVPHRPPRHPNCQVSLTTHRIALLTESSYYSILTFDARCFLSTGSRSSFVCRMAPEREFMSTEVIQILRLKDGRLVDALLHDVVGLDQLALAESKWKPARYQAVLDLLRGGTPRNQIPEHWHWDWAAKVGQTGTVGIQLFGVECEGEWQGLMMTTTIGHVARLAPDAGKPLVYVKYVESAPWNLRSMTKSPRFSAVGARLIEAAVRHSVESGCDGRVGLHALPSAQRFYEKLWFVGLGMDASVEELVYYELTGSASTKILNGGMP